MAQYLKQISDYLTLKKRVFLGMIACFIKGYNLYNFKFGFARPALNNLQETAVKNRKLSLNEKIDSVCKFYLSSKYYSLKEMERKRFLANYIWGANPGREWHWAIEAFYTSHDKFAKRRESLINGILSLKADEYDTVVEIGTGNGWFLNMLSKRIDRNINFIGLDLNGQIIEKVKHRYKDNKNLDFKCADIQSFTRDNSIAGKILVTCAVLEYFSFEELTSFCRLLKKTPPCYLAILERVRIDHGNKESSVPIGDFSYSHDYKTIFGRLGIEEFYSHKGTCEDDPGCFDLSAIFKISN